MEPEALAKLLQDSKGAKPVVLHVGFKNFYDQARITGSDYAGPGSTAGRIGVAAKESGSFAARPADRFVLRVLSMGQVPECQARV